MPLIGEIPSPAEPAAGLPVPHALPDRGRICRTAEPEWRRVGDSMVACHFAAVRPGYSGVFLSWCTTSEPIELPPSTARLVPVM